MKVEIEIQANTHLEAKAVKELLQNIADNTDKTTKNFLLLKIMQKPDYFKNIAEKLKNPIIQKLIG